MMSFAERHPPLTPTRGRPMLDEQRADVTSPVISATRELSDGGHVIAVLALHLVLPAALITGWILAARADAHILTRSSLYASITALCALGIIVGGASLSAILADRSDPTLTDSTPAWLLTGNSLFGLLTTVVLWIAARGSHRLLEIRPDD